MRTIKNKSNYYQSKYLYYKTLVFYLIIASCGCQMMYFVSDCQIFKTFAIQTVIPRFIIIIPTILFCILYKHTNNYAVIIPTAYFFIHLNMWCTIWAIYYLPNKTFAREGFIIMHFMFFCLGLCSPIGLSICMHILVLANILISNTFNHYGSLDMMISLAIPLMIGIEFIVYICDKTYKDIYESKISLEYSAYHDQLTQAYNRNYIQTLCEPDSEILNFPQYSVMIMDIDYFKIVNDTFGHNKGDIVLQEIVKSINKFVQDTDIVIRWGGEEFVVILPRTSLDKTFKIAETIRQDIQNNCKTICDITVSIGVSEATKDKTYNDNIRRADKALYKAKSTGRNKTVKYRKTAS